MAARLLSSFLFPPAGEAAGRGEGKEEPAREPTWEALRAMARPTATMLSDAAAASVRSASAASAILVVDDIVKRFETPDGVLTAVDHVSFTVAPGAFLAVIGPS